MTCTACGKTNRAGARFCDECGKPLAPRCPACMAECRPDARFCDACGTPLAAAARPADAAGARKVISIVFADLVGSTALHERLDAESARRFMERYYAAMRTAVEGYGGTVTQLLGDGVKALFGAPRVGEDDALCAVRAAVAMQRAFRTLAEAESTAVGKTGLRVAVNTGEVVVAEGGEIIGDPVNVAARLQEQGRDGDVVVGEATYRLVSDVVTLVPLGTFALKGRAERVGAYRVESLERPAGAAATAFVGREEELRRLVAVYDAAVAAPAGKLAVLLGSPGLGKSRLISELGRRLGDRATVLTARLSATGGATFAPLAEAFRTFLGFDDAAGGDAVRAALATFMGGDEAERTRIVDGVAALLAGTPVSPEETFFAVRRFLAALAATQPVVLVLDDLHWAEPLLLDLTEHLVQWSAGVPLLVVAAARPELREARSTLAVVGPLVHEVVTLGGLEAGPAMRLAANVIGADELPAVVAGRVLATSEGNPLFVSELVRMLVHDGALKREGERWTMGVEMAQLEIPPTIHALLAARLERLPAEERLILERASVVGRQFSRAAVAHLLPREIANLPAKLEALRRSELIEPDTGWFLGEPVLRFHHVLVRDAAYRRLLKETRAELHGRFVDWLEARVGDAIEHDETIGWHLEQAHRHLGELGPLDDAGRALGERAARYLGAAGRRALARDDVPLAASLLGRALARLEAADPARPELALEWCEALLAAGDVAEATGAIAELGRFAATSERLHAWHTCFTGQLAVLTDPQALHATSEAVAAAATVLAAAGDAAGEAKAHQVHANALARLGRIGACEAALDRALAAARQAGDRRRANAVLAGAPLAALWGPSPVTRASGRCLDVVRVLRITHGAPAVEAVALSCQAVLEALRGRSEAARRMIASSRRMVEELGITHRLLEADVFAGSIELFEGDAVAAERALRPAYEGLRAHGLAIDAAQAAALLGRALLALGRAEDAEAISRESEALAGDDLGAAIAWRGVRAEALARRGEHDAAVELARAAVELAAATDALLHHADARLALAVALRAAGRRTESDAEEARAIALWDAKGATLLADRARRDVAGAAATPATLNAPTTPPAVRRHVRPNAATVNLERLDAAIPTRDAAVIAALCAEGISIVDHTTGFSFETDEEFAADLRYTMSAPGLAVRHEPLATLGDTLALCRRSWSGPGSAGRTLDVGPYEGEQIIIAEVDASGRRRMVERFAPDHLADAVARLYERHAELMPEGPARTRAATTARSVATLLAAYDPERWESALATTVEFRDRRTGGLYPSGRVTAAEMVAMIRVVSETADDITIRAEDILVLRADGLVVRRTVAGKERVGGGAFENRLIALWLFDAAGLLDRHELFDAERDAEALARFDMLSAAPMATPAGARPAALARRVRPNRATACRAAMDAAIAARDPDAFPALIADDNEVVDHTTGTTYDRAGSLTTLRTTLTAEGFTMRSEPLATLGDSLALFRERLAASGFAGATFDVGAYDRERLVVLAVDGEGRQRASEYYAPDRLGAAIARLYERYAELLPPGSERERVAATARAVATETGPFDPEIWATALAAFAPDIENVDHRPLGTWSAHGAEALLAHYRSMLAVAENMTVREDDVLALAPSVLLLRRTHLGTGRASGGPYERPFLVLEQFGSDGRVIRNDVYDISQERDALARFDALTGEPLAVGFENAATRAQRTVEAAWMARDWTAVAATFRRDFRCIDRRAMIQLELDRERMLEFIRILFEMPASQFQTSVLATRGARLALMRTCFTGADREIGETEIEALNVHEVDEHGDRVLMVRFDPAELDAAYAELDRRYFAGEAVAAGQVAVAMETFLRAIAIRDWSLMASVLAPDLVVTDHRPLGWETMRGSAAYVDSLKSLVEFAPDVRLRNDHLRLSTRAALFVNTWVGTREGGAFEAPRAVVFGLDAGGRIHSMDFYEFEVRFEGAGVEQLADAEARFAAVGTGAGRDPLAALARPNAATRANDRLEAAFAARDWSAMRAAFARDAKVEERRFGLVLHDADAWIADMQRLAEGGLGELATLADWGYERQLVATAGERVDLARLHWAGLSDGAPFDIEHLTVTEVDENGLITALVTFDLDDRHAALREMRTRWLAHDAVAAVAGGPLSEFLDAFNDHDRDRLRAAVADDVVLHDHRRTGVGSIEGVEPYLDALAVLWNLAPDMQVETAPGVVAYDRRGAVHLGRIHGTLADGGGAFESCLATLTIVERGRIARIEQFEIEDVDAALARFAELRPDPLRIPPNAATRASVRWQEHAEAGDWDALRALCASEYVWDDRRRGVLLTGDRELFITSNRYVFSRGARPARTVLAIAGDRLALERFVWTGTSDVPFEMEQLALTEVDAEGRLVARLVFDPDAHRAASTEMSERFAASEAGRWIPANFLEFSRALHDHDLARMGAALPDEFVFDDRRRTGLGRLEGADAYLPAVAAVFEQSLDVITETLHYLEVDTHGCLSVTRLFGTLVDGGPFENVAVQISHLRGGRFVAVELFELEDLERARARFDELRPDPLRIPPNAASRTRDRCFAAAAADDWAALRALACERFVFEDRSKAALLSGDLDPWIESVRYLQSEGGTPTRERIGTAGERIVIERITWTEAPTSRFELEHLVVVEVDAEGRFAASIKFDPDDRAAAFLEAELRFAAGEAGGARGLGLFGGAFVRRDWQAFRAAIAPDVTIRDHRVLGFFENVDSDRWVDSVRILPELAPDVSVESFRMLAWNAHGHVAATRVVGTMRDGGPFEYPFVRVIVTDGDRIRHFEIFPVDDADRAVSHFEELCTGLPLAAA